jgi:penicillin-binding protein 1B
LAKRPVSDDKTKTVTKRKKAVKVAVKQISKQKSAVSKKTRHSKAKQHTWPKRLGFLLLKCSLAFSAIFILYGIYLDSKIQARFSGPIWHTPAQLYARSLVLSPDMYLPHDKLIDELELLNYLKVATPTKPGQYSASSSKVELVRRSFAYLDGTEPSQRLFLSFENNRLLSIRDQKTGHYLNAVNLDPMLLDTLQAPNQEDRILVELQNYPQLLIDTLLLVEDRNFYHHNGVSPVAIIRAAMANMNAGRTVQGGSTLTQQLVKNFFLTRQRSLWRKFNEAYMAILMTYRLSKDAVLSGYLNEVYLGQNYNDGVYGFGLASYFYFGRPVPELSIDQIAFLVAVVKGPSFYDPWRYPERAQDRRDMIIRLLAKNGHISTVEYRAAIARPLNVIPRGHMSVSKAPAFISLLRRELKVTFGDALYDQSGLKIYTSLDPLAQRAVEQAITQTLPRLEKARSITGLEAAVVVTDRHYGRVTAMVGGRHTQYAGFNRALDASRSIGSLVKPAIYLTAFEQGYELNSPLEDKPIQLNNQYGKNWQPKNYDRKYRGEVPLYQALMQSLNVPTVNLGMALGVDSVIDSLHRLGIEKVDNHYPSMLLGALNMSPFQVSQMYQTIATSGEYHKLTGLVAVVDEQGDLVYQQALKGVPRFAKKDAELTVYNMTLVAKQGTARRLSWQFPNISLAGKTGTTDKLRDSWFVGLDNRDVVTVWIGKDNNKSAQLTGSSGALTVFSDYLKLRSAESLVVN